MRYAFNLFLNSLVLAPDALLDGIESRPLLLNVLLDYFLAGFAMLPEHLLLKG